MSEGLTIIVSAVIGGILSGIFLYSVLKNHRSPATIETEAKKVIYMLFLYAEKQGWTGSNKMAYVASKIYDFIPGKELADILAGQNLVDYLQAVYEEVRDRLN